MRLILFLAALILLCPPVYGQEGTYRLSELLPMYEKEFGITFSYDAGLVELIDKKMERAASIEEVSASIENAFPFKIKKISDQYYALSAKEITVEVSAQDSAENTSIHPKELIVLVNNQPIPAEVANNGLQFLYKPSISDTVEVYSVGYNKMTLSLYEIMNQRSMTVKMVSPFWELSEVTVEDYLTRGIDMTPSKQNITIAVKDLPLLPGETDGDIFASLTALPGVTNPDGRAGNLFIRGSDPDQTLVVFDNIPIYYKGHYFGTISPYNPKTIDNVEVYRGGFHPRLGDRVGGAVVINSGSTSGNKPTVGTGVNTLFGMGYVKVPLAGNKVGISIGARRSYPPHISSPKLSAITESVYAGTGLVDSLGNVTGEVNTVFSDYHAKINLNLNDRNRVSITGILAQTEIESRIEEAIGSPLPPEVTSFENSGMNLSWVSRMGRDWTSTFSATVSDYSFAYKGSTPDSVLGAGFSTNDLMDFNLAQEFSIKSPHSVNYQFGVDYKYQTVSTEYRNPVRADSSIFYYNDQSEAQSFSTYANVELNQWEKWYLELGVRGTYYQPLENFRLTPRLLVNYDISRAMTLKGSAGLYNQYLSQVKNLEFGGGGFDTEVWTLADEEMGFIINGTQSMIGAILQNRGWILDVEAFYKSAHDVTIFENRRLYEGGTFHKMDQSVSGLDVFLKKQISENTSAWAGYSYGHSEIKLDSTDQLTYSSKYFQPNVLYVGSSYAGKRLKLAAAWKYSSGLNAQSMDIAYAENIFLNNRPSLPINPPPPGSGPPRPPRSPFADREERYPYMHQLDLSASYTLPRTETRKWSASLGVSLINVFDQEILVDQVYRSREFQNRYALGFAPNIMLIVEW